MDKSRQRKEREELQAALQQPPHPSSQAVQPQFPPPSSTPSDLPKKERKRRTNNSSKRKEDGSQDSQRGTSSFNKHQYPKGPSSPENSSNSSSSRSIQPSPTSATPRQVMRPVDEDYDEGVADALIVLSNSSKPDGPTQSPSPRVPSHRNSISSTGASPPVQMAPMKRALSQTG
jgi:glucose repression mediator protein